MPRIRNIFEKYKEIISYGFWGVITTLVNYAVFFVCLRLFDINYLISNIGSWVCAVTFAYVTNKVFVFNSTDWSMSKLKTEVLSFLDGFFHW